MCVRRSPPTFRSLNGQSRRADLNVVTVDHDDHDQLAEIADLEFKLGLIRAVSDIPPP